MYYLIFDTKSNVYLFVGIVDFTKTSEKARPSVRNPSTFQSYPRVYSVISDSMSIIPIKPMDF